MQFKYARSLTYGASISWGHSRLLGGISTFSWPLTTCRNRLKQKRSRVVVKFLKSLFALFGTPRAIISDRGTHFCNDQFTKVMLKYGVAYRLSTAYHLQMSGQVEVLNHGLKRILERTTRCDHQKVQMNELNELRDQAYENSLIYKEKTKKIHDSKIKNRIFNVGDRVFSFNSRLSDHLGLANPRWIGTVHRSAQFSLWLCLDASHSSDDSSTSGLHNSSLSSISYSKALSYFEYTILRTTFPNKTLANISFAWLVTDIHKRTKTKAKRTKPSMRLERA
ncbi:reverse transcriptase domain-containing protein [Tanacetum coccineum]